MPTPGFLDHLSNVNATLLPMTLLGIICRLVKQSQQLLRFTIGLFINLGRFLVPWVTELKFIKLRLPWGKERGDIEIKGYVVVQKASLLLAP